jgi:hypothetical protein
VVVEEVAATPVAPMVAPMVEARAGTLEVVATVGVATVAAVRGPSALRC